MIPSKPESCAGCPLVSRGRGWVPPSGPAGAKILFVGDSPTGDDCAAGRPFSGSVGAFLNRALYMLDKEKDSFLLSNVIQCSPPGMWLGGAPWEYGATTQCKENLDAAVGKNVKVIVPLGDVALRTVMDLPYGKGFDIKNFHGTVSKDPTGKYWVVPTFHPAYLQRGANNLFGTFLWDLKQAIHVAENGWKEDTPNLLCDPSVEEWEKWVGAVLERVEKEGADSVWLAVDIETPDKERQQDEGELGVKDRSRVITRVNFAVGPDEGVTVPFLGRYVDGIRSLLSCGVPLSLWNARYDIPRLRLHGCPPAGRVLDWMWGWHVLQSDTPRGLGFVAPFYSSYGAWKHLSGSDAVKYAALDGVQTWRIADGIARDLQANGQWDVFINHVVLLDETVLEPAENVGMLVDKVEIEGLRRRLHAYSTEFYARIQELVPDELKRFHPKEGWKKPPKEGTIEELNETRRKNESPLLLPALHIREKSALVIVCRTCGAEDVTKKHRCENGEKPELELDVEVKKNFYYAREEFNPASPQQVLSYIKHHKHKVAMDKKTGKESTNKLALESLAKTVKDPKCKEFYSLCLSRREVTKVEGTYVVGNLKRLEEQERGGITDGRLHGTFTHKPSTLRLSMVNPNLQNVVADRGGKESLSAGFKKCLIAAPGCKLIEADYSGIEAVLTGWFAADPLYIRLATLGVHAWLLSHDVGKPVDLSWSDADIGAYFKELKKKYDPQYQRCKRVVHGTSYGLTPYGMHERMPAVFPTLASAKKVQDLFFSLAPSIHKFQNQVREIAHKQHYLGGVGAHPFAYKHWFWDVFTYRKIPDSAFVSRQRQGLPCTRMNGQSYAIQLGEDGKRVVAFYPQSTGGAVIKETGLRLHNPEHESYIGDVFYGRTPTRALIHDSFLLEVPNHRVDEVVEKLVREMTKEIPELPCPAEWGIGPFLKIGVAVKVGKSWGEMEDLNFTGVEGGVALDSGVYEEEEDEEEAWG